MKKRYAALFLALAAGAVHAASDSRADDLIVTASNAAQNTLLVYDTANRLVQALSTHGQGGVSGNAGGIAAYNDLVAVVNFGSRSVTLFRRTGRGFTLQQVIATPSAPVSVAFGHDHLYVLGTTDVTSHRMVGSAVAAAPDGKAALLKADGSAGQVGVVPGALVITEKSNAVETVALAPGGAVSGPAASVQGLPANINTPLGLVTRGDDAYVTIAHADEISLVRDGSVLAVTPSGTQHAPCWLALTGPFLFSSNSPSSSISRYAVYGKKIVQDAAVAAVLNGAPTDIAYRDGWIAVIDGSAGVSHLSVFAVDEDGNLTLKAVTSINAGANGVAVVAGED